VDSIVKKEAKIFSITMGIAALIDLVRDEATKAELLDH